MTPRPSRRCTKQLDQGIMLGLELRCEEHAANLQTHIIMTMLIVSLAHLHFQYPTLPMHAHHSWLHTPTKTTEGLVESRFVLHEDALLTHGRGDAQQPTPCQGCAPTDPVSKLVLPQVSNHKYICLCRIVPTQDRDALLSHTTAHNWEISVHPGFDVHPCLLALELGPRLLSIHHCHPGFSSVQLFSASCRWLHPSAAST